MRVLETYNVLGHEVNIQMDSIESSVRDFICSLKVDNNKDKVFNCIYGEDELFTPEKVLVSTIEEALSYAKSPTLGDFIKNGNFDNSGQDINEGEMLFHSAKDSHIWMVNNFTKEEIKELYKAIEPDLDLDSIKNEVFLQKDSRVFGSSNNSMENAFQPIDNDVEQKQEDFER